MEARPPAPDPQPQRQSPRISPHPQPPSPTLPPAMPTRSEAGRGELPGEAQARRPQRRAGLRGRELARSRSLQPGAASPAAAAASSRRKPEDGGAAQRRPGKEAVSPDPAGDQRGVRGARRRVRCPPLPGPDPRRLRRAPLESRGSSSRGSGCGRPRVRGGRCGAVRCRESRRGVPGRARLERAEPLPFWLAGLQPRALPGRPGQENHQGRARGKRRVALDEVGGSGSTDKETLPSRPGLFGKLQGRKRGAARELPPPRRAGRRQK